MPLSRCASEPTGEKVADESAALATLSRCDSGIDGSDREDYDDSSFMQRQAERFDAKSGALICVLSTATEQGLAAQVIDLSRMGMRLVCNRPLARGETFEATIGALRCDIAYEITGIVRWQHLLGGSRCSFGVEIQPPLPAEAIEQLMNLNLLERRRNARYAVRVPADVRIEMELQSLPVTIVEYSSGGMRIHATRQVPKGCRMLVEVRDVSGGPATFPTQVVWSRECPGGYQMGMTYTSRIGAETMRRICSEKSDNRNHELMSRMGRPSFDAATQKLTAKLGSVTNWFRRAEK